MFGLLNLKGLIEMYYIVFHYSNQSTETYSGGFYIFQGEKYACFNNRSPKLYKSKKVAKNAAKNLINNCANTSCNFEVLEMKG